MSQERKNILITGGAGFIGSNLTEVLLEDSRVNKIRVLDDLSNGFIDNIKLELEHPRFEFIEGDIRNYETCLEACKGMDLISHQAALGSVPRSLKDPLTSNAVNITGTLNIFSAAKEQNIKRVVFAASSSTYGDSETLPKVENNIGQPLSPYAITKYVNELYAKVFANNYNFKFIGLRYFNVFGPKQDPHGAYAAVIPLFFKAALSNMNPTINGNGSHSRDFTYVENVIEANILSLFTSNEKCLNQIFNVACGERTTILELWEAIKSITNSESQVLFGPKREGDIPHSLADISKAKSMLDYKGEINVNAGLEKCLEWYKIKFG